MTVGTVPHYHATLGRFLGVCGSLSWGFPRASDGKEPACSTGDPGFDPWVREYPLEKGMATHPSILAWIILRTEATVHEVSKSQTRLSD